MLNFTLSRKNILLLLCFISLSVNSVLGQCPPGQIEEPETSHVYAESVYSSDNVKNASRALGSDDSRVASFDENGAELVLEMSSVISTGSSVTVNGVDGGKVDVWVWSSSSVRWIRVGSNVSLDYTFTSTIDWTYIRIEQANKSGGMSKSVILMPPLQLQHVCQIQMQV